MSQIINNNNKFEIISQDIARVLWTMEDKINTFLRKIKGLGHISQALYEQLYVTGAGPGILYGLPKVHKPQFKENFLYRPIFAAYNTASYNISKYLVQNLTPIAENEYTIKNSTHFKSEIENVPNSEGLVMASFDIKDLYTNIPLQETIDICIHQLQSELFNLPQQFFRQMLEISVFNTVFAFKDNFYRQIDGLGMGLPLSPTLANIFLCFHERNWLNRCPLEFKPVFYKRYMDDTCLLFRHQSHVDKFLEYLNSQHSNIQFTSENEENGHLSFLDCNIARDNNRFVTSVYRKDTFTGLGLSFFSHCPNIFKINSIKTLLVRAYNISSTFAALNKELIFLRKYFCTNGYPEHLVYRQIQSFIRKITYPPPPIHTAEKRKIYCSLPFTGTQSEKLKKELTSFLQETFPQVDVNLIFVNKFTIANFFPFKERLPMGLKSSVVYKFSCAQCASGTYVGSTTRATHMRIAEHRGRSFRTGKLLANPGHSAIREHALKCRQTISEDDFTILGQEGAQTHLRILESIFIHQLKPGLNNMQSAFPLRIVA